MVLNPMNINSGNSNGNALIDSPIKNNSHKLGNVEWTLARVFNKEIDFLRKMELLKEYLCQLVDFSPLNAYRIMDDESFGGITTIK